MQRFSFSHLSLGKDIIINENLFIHQISHVLRSKIGDTIILFNGDGWEYPYAINVINKKEVYLVALKRYKNICDSRTIVRLYQALPNKYEKLEYILQKGAEVGIREFVFFRSERSQNLIINARKGERFREILRESIEQCGENQVPSIVFLEKEIPVPKDGSSYVFHTEEEGSKHIRDINISPLPINIFIGPEGGWSPQEMACFDARNIEKIHLGQRILRTETTGPVAAFFLIQK